jgi:hypothetical protein
MKWRDPMRGSDEGCACESKNTFGLTRSFILIADWQALAPFLSTTWLESPVPAANAMSWREAAAALPA